MYSGSQAAVAYVDRCSKNVYRAGSYAASPGSMPCSRKVARSLSSSIFSRSSSLVTVFRPAADPAHSRPATRLAKIAGPLGAVVQRQITAAWAHTPSSRAARPRPRQRRTVRSGSASFPGNRTPREDEERRRYPHRSHRTLCPYGRRPSAVRGDWREQEHRQGMLDTDPSLVSYRRGVGYRRSAGHRALSESDSTVRSCMPLWSTGGGQLAGLRRVSQRYQWRILSRNRGL
jgi:hypothetical protein